MAKLVKCIVSGTHTIAGKVYAVAEETTAYYMLSEFPDTTSYKYRFVVVARPCDVKNCLKHTKGEVIR